MQKLLFLHRSFGGGVFICQNTTCPGSMDFVGLSCSQFPFINSGRTPPFSSAGDIMTYCIVGYCNLLFRF